VFVHFVCWCVVDLKMSLCALHLSC
jgi:hypothetical protein